MRRLAAVHGTRALFAAALAVGLFGALLCLLRGLLEALSNLLLDRLPLLDLLLLDRGAGGRRGGHSGVAGGETQDSNDKDGTAYHASLRPSAVLMMYHADDNDRPFEQTIVDTEAPASGSRPACRWGADAGDESMAPIDNID